MPAVQFNYEYFPDPTKGRPVFNGDIFVGRINTDPEVEGNQQQITVIQEDGTEVDLAQPIKTNNGGLPTHNGSVVKMKVPAAYSLKILNAQGKQVYNDPKSTVGTTIINVDDHGAVGDYDPDTNTGTDDSAAFQSAFDEASNVNGCVEASPEKNYLLDEYVFKQATLPIDTKNRFKFNGNNCTITLGDNTGYCAFEFRNFSFIEVSNVKFDGNKSNQTYPGSPNGDAWTRAVFTQNIGHNPSTTGTLGFNQCCVVYAHHLEFVDFVVGISSENFELTIFDHIRATGQPIDMWDQGGISKFVSAINTNRGTNVMYSNLSVEEVNGGISYATSTPGEDGTPALIPTFAIVQGNNLTARNCGHRTFSFESPFELHLANLHGSNDEGGSYTGTCFIGNDIDVVNMSNIRFVNVPWNNKNDGSASSASLNGFALKGGSFAQGPNGFTNISNGVVESVTFTGADSLSSKNISNVTFDDCDVTGNYVACNSGTADNILIRSPAATTGTGIAKCSKVSNCDIDGITICVNPGDTDCHINGCEFSNSQAAHVSEANNRSTHKMIIDSTKFLNAGLGGNTSCIALDWGVVMVSNSYFEDSGGATTLFALSDFDGNTGSQVAWTGVNNVTKDLVSGNGDAAFDVTTALKTVSGNLSIV